VLWGLRGETANIFIVVVRFPWKENSERGGLSSCLASSSLNIYIYIYIYIYIKNDKKNP